MVRVLQAVYSGSRVNTCCANTGNTTNISSLVEESWLSYIVELNVVRRFKGWLALRVARCSEVSDSLQSNILSASIRYSLSSKFFSIWSVR